LVAGRQDFTAEAGEGAEGTEAALGEEDRSQGGLALPLPPSDCTEYRGSWWPSGLAGLGASRSLTLKLTQNAILVG
jgi:hypothetical protein